MHALDGFVIVPFPKLCDQEQKTISATVRKSAPLKCVYHKKSRPGLKKQYGAVTRIEGRLKHVGYFHNVKEAQEALESYLQNSCVWAKCK